MGLLFLATPGVLRPLQVRRVLERHPLGFTVHLEGTHGGFSHDVQYLTLRDAVPQLCFSPYIKVGIRIITKFLTKLINALRSLEEH